MQPSVWKFRSVPESLTGLDGVRQQRVLKICPHRYLGEYDVSVWVDGNITVTGDLMRLLAEYDLSKTPLYTRIHPSRNCVYDEAETVLMLRKDSPAVVGRVVARYRGEGYPERIGLAETCVLLRRHNDAKCRMFDDAWATEVLLNSRRDQLSFNYVAWKQRFEVGYMTNQFRVDGNGYFRMAAHG